jgi:transcriptional regulator with XRE-family HTH domain
MVSVAERFGDNLARQRKLADMSQDETALRAGVNRTEISQIERGLRLPRVDTVAKIAAALEIEPGELFEGITWQPGNVQIGHFRSIESQKEDL